MLIMETVTFKNTPSYRRIMMQHGKGFDRDGYYVYNQEGEGIGSFFSSLLRGALPIVAPLAAEAIKGLTSKAVNHTTNAIVNSSRKRRVNTRKQSYTKRARL